MFDDTQKEPEIKKSIIALYLDYYVQVFKALQIKAASTADASKQSAEIALALVQESRYYTDL